MEAAKTRIIALPPATALVDSDSLPIDNPAMPGTRSVGYGTLRDQLVDEARIDFSVDVGVYQQHYYLAARTDGEPGTGGPQDPFNVSGAERFDAFWKQAWVVASRNTAFHIAPGNYETHGNRNSGSGQVYTNLPTTCAILGAGIDATHIKLVGPIPAVAPDFYNIIVFHGRADLTDPVQARLMTVADLTIDLNAAALHAIDAEHRQMKLSGVVLFGSDNCTIARVKVLHPCGVLQIAGVLVGRESFPLMVSYTQEAPQAVVGRETGGHLVTQSAVMDVVRSPDDQAAGTGSYVSAIAVFGQKLDGVELIQNRVTQCRCHNQPGAPTGWAGISMSNSSVIRDCFTDGYRNPIYHDTAPLIDVWIDSCVIGVREYGIRSGRLNINQPAENISITNCRFIAYAPIDSSIVQSENSAGATSATKNWRIVNCIVDLAGAGRVVSHFYDPEGSDVVFDNCVFPANTVFESTMPLRQLRFLNCRNPGSVFAAQNATGMGGPIFNVAPAVAAGKWVRLVRWQGTAAGLFRVLISEKNFLGHYEVLVALGTYGSMSVRGTRGYNNSQAYISAFRAVLKGTNQVFLEARVHPTPPAGLPADALMVQAQLLQDATLTGAQVFPEFSDAEDTGWTRLAELTIQGETAGIDHGLIWGVAGMISGNVGALLATANGRLHFNDQRTAGIQGTIGGTTLDLFANNKLWAQAGGPGTLVTPSTPGLPRLVHGSSPGIYTPPTGGPITQVRCDMVHNLALPTPYTALVFVNGMNLPSVGYQTPFKPELIQYLTNDCRAYWNNAPYPPGSGTAPVTFEWLIIA